MISKIIGRALLPTLVLLSSQVRAEEVDLLSFCSNDMRIETLQEVIKSLGPLSGPDRVSCLLKGEQVRVCRACTNKVSPKQIAVLRKMMDPTHRRWHQEWHNVRQWIGPANGRQLALANCPRVPGAEQSFLRMVGDQPGSDVPENLNSDAKKSFDDFFARKKMEPGERQKFMNDHDAFQGKVAGEDFFFMHREMVKMAQTALTVAKEECIDGWKDLPSATDKDWPTPLEKKQTVQLQPEKGRTLSQRDRAGQAAANDFLQKLRSPAYLKTVSLNQLGTCVEHSIHAFLHLKYADGQARCKSLDDQSETCDDLLPSATSPSNSQFWKIHGLIDNLIGDWLKANGKDSISRDCAGEKNCQQWSKDVWVGDMPALNLKQ